MKIFARPSKEKLKVRFAPPSPRVVPAEGCWLTMDPWWQGKVREGDLVVCEPPIPQNQEKTEEV